MSDPYYQPISLEQTPVLEEDGSKLWVVSGDYQGIKGAAPAQSPQILLRGEIQEGAETVIDIPKSYNTIVYLLDGEVEASGQSLKRKDMAVFYNDGEEISIKASKNTRYIVLSGEPINEPVASYGPFVMTNETELMEALRDAQMGKMGVLIEEF
jgi:redox-sensitive bicupin YhaK (pirin superfamily)